MENIETRKVGIAAGLIKSIGHVPNGLAGLVDHITFGSFTLPPRDGNKEPTYYFNPVSCASYNAVGLKNMSLLTFIVEQLIGKRHAFLELKAQGCKTRISLAPLKTGDLKEMLRILLEYWFQIFDLIDEIEVNGACPNHRDEGGRLHDVLSKDPIALELLMMEGVDCPCSKTIKIAPNTTYECLETTVRLSIAYGYSTIVSGNTLLSDTPIDTKGRQHISVPKCGMAGAPLLERALKQASTLSQIISTKSETHVLPSIIGCGGIMSASDARYYLAVERCTTVQIATYYMEYGVRGVQDLVASIM